MDPDPNRSRSGPRIRRISFPIFENKNIVEI